MEDSGQPDVTALVPARNEEATIKEVIDRLLALPLKVQVIVINDGSTDRTQEILDAYGDEIVAIHNTGPGGKGRAIRLGLPYAQGKVVMIQDADLEYFPEEIPKLVEPILGGLYGVVYGSRFSHGLPKAMALPNKIVNLLLRWSVRFLFGHRITDEATCYKAFRSGLLEQMELECERFEFCPEVTAKAIRMGEHIHEVPIKYEPRSYEAGKKIRWTDAPEAFWTLLRHKFSRLDKPED